LGGWGEDEGVWTVIMIGLLCLATGWALGWLAGRLKAARAGADWQAEKAAQSVLVGQLEEQREAARRELAGERERMATLTGKAALAEQLETQRELARGELAAERGRLAELTARVATLEAEREGLLRRLEEDAKRVAEVQEKFRAEFENLANRLLEEKSAKFLALNQEGLTGLLDPLRQRIGEFRERIEAIHTEETKTSAAMRQELVQLKELNQQMSGEAQALTRALKGDAKTRGAWGELVLERLLEHSGLQKGSEYETQAAYTGEDGSRYFLDAVVRLPEGRDLIIDSKVSLTAYERCLNAPGDGERALALREHVGAMRRHIDELSRKNYAGLAQVNSPELVLMFVPIEPALHLALQHDPEFFTAAFAKNVMPVSSSTLLITLRAVDSVWKRQKQAQNAKDIALKAGGLYDQFARFVESLEAIGQRLEQARGAYEEALGRLSGGRGNLVKRAQELRAMGIRAEKQLPPALVERGEEE